MKYSEIISTFNFSFCHYLEKNRHREKTVCDMKMQVF
jgi:hypothetical protein